MQASSEISYESNGRIFRFQDFNADAGRQLNNGLASTVAGRLQNWLDADGSASGWRGTPSIIGSAVADAGDWWHLDNECLGDASSVLWHCQALQGSRRQIGSINMQWTRGTSRATQTPICTCRSSVRLAFVSVFPQRGRSKSTLGGQRAATATLVCRAGLWATLSTLAMAVVPVRDTLSL
jgi:hypothetical protein